MHSECGKGKTSATVGGGGRRRCCRCPTANGRAGKCEPVVARTSAHCSVSSPPAVFRRVFRSSRPNRRTFSPFLTIAVVAVCLGSGMTFPMRHHSVGHRRRRWRGRERVEGGIAPAFPRPAKPRTHTQTALNE